MISASLPAEPEGAVFRFVLGYPRLARVIAAAVTDDDDVKDAVRQAVRHCNVGDIVTNINLIAFVDRCTTPILPIWQKIFVTEE